MRVLVLVLWMLIPVGAFAYHLGPGQSDLKRDKVALLLADANGFVENENWEEAESVFKSALELLPEDEVDTNRRTRLELAKVQLMNKGLPQANEDLKVLVNELEDEAERWKRFEAGTLSADDDGADIREPNPGMLADARTALANSQYYITWLMRVEGRPETDWEPEITSSQQIYRLLAEESAKDSDQEMIAIRKSDLESAVKLARMDLGELQGLPLPSQ